MRFPAFLPLTGPAYWYNIGHASLEAPRQISGLVLGNLTVFLVVLLYLISHREARMLVQKSEGKQHLLAFTIVQNLRESMIKARARRRDSD